MKKLLLLLLFTLLPIVARAYDAQIDGIYYILNPNEMTAEVTYYSLNTNESAYSGVINIPSEVSYKSEKYIVTSISRNAFRYCTNITLVTIPNSIISIGSWAFMGCSSLTSVSIPNSVTSIGQGAFDSCSRMTTINIPNGLNRIPGSIFRDCSSLTSVTIPEGVTTIGGEAFMNCTNLKSISIPRSVTTIETYAFDNCSSLKDVYRFIDDIASWCSEDPTTDNCSNLLVNSPERNLHLCLNDETEITNLIIPEGIKSIRNFAFKNCSGLISVSIPTSVSSIGESAFMYCSGIKALDLPNSITTISTHAFYSCTNLASVTIPSSVVSIGNRAFFFCNNLLTVNSEIAEPFNCTDLFSDNTYRKGILYVPAGTKDLYIRFDGWREFLNIEEVGGEAEQSVWLSIKDAQGTTKIKIKKGTKQELMISPEEGWKILSVTMDGTDVTAQATNGGSFTTPAINSDATIIIVYEEAMPTRRDAATRSQAVVKVVRDGVIISNAEPDSQCVVYQTDGQQVVNTIVGERTRKIVLPQGQVYILTIDGRTLKFAL